MTHDRLVALMGHDSNVRFSLAVQEAFGLALQPVPGETPAERYALDTALVEGQRHAVPTSSAAFLTVFESHLDHRLKLETAALQGDAYALHRLHVGG